jgi:hypothetical protein
VSEHTEVGVQGNWQVARTNQVSSLNSSGNVYSLAFLVKQSASFVSQAQDPCSLGIATAYSLDAQLSRRFVSEVRMHTLVGQLVPLARSEAILGNVDFGTPC